MSRLEPAAVRAEEPRAACHDHLVVVVAAQPLVEEALEGHQKPFRLVVHCMLVWARILLAEYPDLSFAKPD